LLLVDSFFQSSVFRSGLFRFIIKTFAAVYCVFIFNFCVSRCLAFANSKLLPFMLFDSFKFLLCLRLMIIIKLFKMLPCILVRTKLIVFVFGNSVWMKSAFFDYVDIVASKHRRLIKSFNNVYFLKRIIRIDLRSKCAFSNFFFLLNLL